MSLTLPLDAGRPFHAAHRVTQAGSLAGLQEGRDPRQQYQCCAGRLLHFALGLHLAPPAEQGQLAQVSYLSRFHPIRRLLATLSVASIGRDGRHELEPHDAPRSAGRAGRNGAVVGGRFHTVSLAACAPAVEYNA